MLFGIDHKQHWQTNKSYALNGGKAVTETALFPFRA